MSQALVDNFNNTIADVGELEELARGVDTTSVVYGSPGFGNSLLGIVTGLMVLIIFFCMSRTYTAEEQEAMAEVERNRIAAEKEKIQDMETYRSTMANIIQKYVIHLTNITSRSPAALSTSKHVAVDVRKTRQIPNGSEDDEVPIETITISSDSSTEVEDNDSDSDNGFIISGVEIEIGTSSTPIIPTLAIDGDNNRQTEIDEAVPPLASSSSSTTTSKSTITHANLREAVTDNPCSICLEPFRVGDDIVCCSNNVTGKKPHVFHQACSLDYIVTHTDGINAPCPCCRRLLLPSEAQCKRGGCLRHCHGSALTLPELGENDDDDDDDDDDNF